MNGILHKKHYVCSQMLLFLCVFLVVELFPLYSVISAGLHDVEMHVEQMTINIMQLLMQILPILYANF